MALQPVARDYEGGAVRANGNRDGRGRGMQQWVERAVVETLEGRMEEDTELEEGETVEGGHLLDDLDPMEDLRFSYFDTKIESLLGDSQREFSKGNLYHEELGSKVGVYGSFLPAHVRVPPVLSGQPPAPAAVPSRSRLLEKQIERGRRIVDNGPTAAPDRSAVVSPNGTGTKSNVKINGVNHTGDGFAVVPGKGTKRKDNCPVDQKNGRGITFRINLGKGANKAGKKTLYNGFGLDNSSSPSTDEDPDDALSASEDETSLQRSPLDMIRVMTSFVVPRGGLLSPLCDVLMPEYLERKEKPLLNAKSSKKQITGSHALRAEPSPGLVATKHENDMGKDVKVVKEKIEKVKGKPLDRREATPVVDPVKVSKKDLENDGRTGKEGGGNGQKGFPKVAERSGPRDLDSRGDKVDRDVDLRDIVGKEGDNIKDPARISRKDKVSNSFTVDMPKEDGSELPTNESREVRKAREDSTKDLKRSREPSIEPSLKDVAAKETFKEKRKMGGNKDTLKVKKDEEALLKDSQKQQCRKDFGKQVEAVSGDILKDGLSEVKKKSKESSKGPQTQKDGKDKAKDAHKDGRWETKKESSKKEALRDVDDMGKEEPRDSSRASVREVPKDSSKDLVKRDGPEQSLKDAKTGKKVVRKGGKEPKAVSKESESGPSVDVPGLGGADSGPPAPHPLPVFAAPNADGPAGAVAPAGHLVLDHWVQCDSCEHWRLLIPTIHIEELPDNWLCKMMTWLPGLNNCKFSEDVTTAAVYKLLGLQHPTLGQGNPGQQHLLAPAMAPPSTLLPENKMLDSKTGKVNRSASKKGMGKKLAAGTVRNLSSNGRRVETNSLRSRSLTDFGQNPVDHIADGYGLESTAAEDGGYSQVPVDVLRKVKQKDKLTDLTDNEGDDFHAQQRIARDEDRNRATGPWSAQQDLGKAVKLPVSVHVDNGAEGNTWVDSDDPESNKQQRGKLLQDGSKLDGAGLKRKKKLGEEEHDELRAKKSKLDSVHKLRPFDNHARPNSHYELDHHSVPHASDEGGGQERESGDRAGVNSRSIARGTTAGPTSGKVKSKDRPRQPEAKKRLKGDDLEFGHQAEKRRAVSKPESKDWGASSRDVVREEKKGQAKRVGISPITEVEFHQHNVEEDAREAESPRNERVEDVRGKNGRLFDEISGIARNYAPQSSGDRADESPNDESPGPDVGTYPEQQVGGSQIRSPASSSSKVSYSTESSAFGSKGGSPLESTVSSSPVRSSKADGAATGRGVSKGVQDNHTTSHRHPSDKRNSLSPSPKRSLDQGADTHSDHEGRLQQSRRNWDHRPHSSDHEREFRGSGRDPGRETASGRGRDDHYATSNSREGAGFRKFDTNRTMRDDDHFWEDGRDTRAGSASYFPERDYLHRDERYREESVERYRGRENRYERRNGREDRNREWDRDRERERSSRENWVPDRSADGHEERHSRERSLRPDRGGRPSSRESRLDKQGTWHDESRSIRDVGRDGRDRGEDDNAEIKHEARSNLVTGLKADHPDEDEHDVPRVQKDDSGHRYEKNDLGLSKDTKSIRAPNSGQASHGWEGDKVGVAFSGRKDSDGSAPRNGSDAMTIHVNSRSRIDVVQNGSGSTGARGKTGQVDGPAHDVRTVEETKQGKELKKVADEERVSAPKALGSSAHVTRSTEGASNLSKKEHAALAKSLSEEGRHLKHTADRLKNMDPDDGESSNLYLQASLKFLLSANHHEMAAVGEGPRHVSAAQAFQLYNETARLFDFCASTYERQRDLAAAALAYNCAAVARFRGLIGRSAGLNKDCMELQSAASFATTVGNQVAPVLTPPTSLPPQPPLALSRASDKPRPSHGVGTACPVGESPSSSSASDVDNLNNHALTGEKGLPSSAVKGAVPSPTPGSGSSTTELVPQRLHPSYHRVIQNGMDLFTMMESWTKAQKATAAADPWRDEGMLAIRRVVEIGLLGDVDEVVRHVRLALEGIGH